MKSAISKVPVLAIPLVIAEYVHTGAGALEQIFDFRSHPFVSALASLSLVVALVISGFCALIYFSKFCLWCLKLLEQGNMALHAWVRRFVLGLLKWAVARLEQPGADQSPDAV